MSGETKTWAIVVAVLSTALTSTGQILLKRGADQLTLTIHGLITNWPLIGGYALYALAAVLFVLARRGGELSVIYPIIATSYVWVSFLSMLFLSEAISYVRWLGVA